MKTIPYQNGKAVCPKCGGMLFYDARITQKLPLGLGFMPGSSKFQVDFAISKGWRGECECGQVVFAIVSARRAVKYPAGINRKLALAGSS